MVRGLNQVGGYIFLYRRIFLWFQKPATKVKGKKSNKTAATAAQQRLAAAKSAMAQRMREKIESEENVPEHRSPMIRYAVTETSSTGNAFYFMQTEHMYSFKLELTILMQICILELHVEEYGKYYI